VEAAYPRIQKNLDAILKRLDEQAIPPKPKPTAAPKPPPEN